MATPILQASPGSFNFAPNIIPPSTGDLEEARIRRLMDTAKLFNLQQEPLQADRTFQLQKAQLAETAGYHNAQIADQTQGRNLEARGQDIQIRGQDLTAQQHADMIHSSMAQHFATLLAARPEVSSDVIAGMAKQYGFPEAVNSILAEKDLKQTEKAKQLATAYRTAAATGDTKATGDLLNTYRAMPDFQELAPKMKALVPQYAKDFNPPTPGTTTKVATPSLGETIGEAANIPLALQRLGNINTKPVSKFFQDIYSGATR